MCKTSQQRARRRKIIRMMSRGVVTAGEMAIKLNVSTRTVYRYVDDLRREGKPIVGEAGMGYMLRRREVRHAN